MDFRDQFRKMSGDVGKMAREVADTSKKATARARIRRMINTCNDSLQTIYQAVICPSCGSKVMETQRFCPNCGCKNASYGKWKAEEEADENARRAAEEAEQAERDAHSAVQKSEEEIVSPEGTAEQSAEAETAAPAKENTEA